MDEVLLDLKGEVDVYARGYDDVAKEVVRQVNLLCREKGEIVEMMERGE